MKPSKGTPFRQSLPVQAIIGGTPFLGLRIFGMDSLRVNVVEGLNVINGPKCNKVINVITFCPKCNKVLNVITFCPKCN